jgi:tRNA(Ser,Leu) C12 N-acetylase TAN1|uniref:THUMP domain-containing protein n=1 Tax=Desulfobacca acetoxidans TaxID=60893 RepID=A0A7C5EW59_9BACT
MKDWNVVLTSHINQERRLMRELADLGEFAPSGFREVVLGRVAEVPGFLTAIMQRWKEQPFFQEVLSSVVPVRLVFPFTLENLVPRLMEHLRPWAAEIGARPFFVRLKRRGHKGEIKSQEVEQTLDRFLKEEIAGLGFTPTIDFSHPEAIVVVEVVHNQCGLGLITRELMEGYPFIRIK